jgi:hypothetical protein
VYPANFIASFIPTVSLLVNNIQAALNTLGEPRASHLVGDIFVSKDWMFFGRQGLTTCPELSLVQQNFDNVLSIML